MISHDEVLKTVYLLPVTIGVLGNGYLIYIYGFHFIAQTRHKHIDLILMHLVFVNTMFLLFRGIPIVIEFGGLNYLLNDPVCKMLIYSQRVCRGLSLCSTCLLSGYQTIVISPSSPKWAALKARSPKCIVLCCALCWILNLLVDIALSVYIIGPRNSTNIKGRNKLDCSLDPYAKYVLKIPVWKTIYVTMFVVFMIITSGYMVYVLYRHNQRVQHIHNTSFTPRASPEIRATKVILALLSIFFFFNTTCSILNTYADYCQVSRAWALHVVSVLSMSFQAVSPFVLLSSDSRITQVFCGLLQRKKYSSMIHSFTISLQTHKES